jgi:hypothetical protein
LALAIDVSRYQTANDRIDATGRFPDQNVQAIANRAQSLERTAFYIGAAYGCR